MHLFNFSLLLTILLLVELITSSSSIKCYWNTASCVNEVISYQSNIGSEFSYHQPVGLCQSCWGNSDCNNTNNFCSKTLINLSSTLVDLANNSITFQDSEFTYYEPNFRESSIGGMFFDCEDPRYTDFYVCQMSQGPEKRSEETVVVSYSDKTIYVTTPDMSLTSIQWFLNEHKDIFICGNDCQYTLKPSYLIKDGVLNVKVFISDMLVAQRSFNIKSTDTCQIQECSFICFSYITNFVCYSSSTQAMLGFSLVSSIIVLSVLIGAFIYKCYGCLGNKFFVHIKGDNNIPLQTLSLCLLICLIISPVGAQCMSTTAISSNINQCTNMFGNHTCKLALNTMITLPNLGNKVCMFLFSPDGHQLGTINISYITSLLVAKTTFQYFSVPWLGSSCSQRDCRNDGVCNLDSGCPLNETEMSHSLAGECLNYPGKTTCRSSCGCAGCGCFFCSDACLISRYYIKPDNYDGYMKVYSIDYVEAFPRVFVEYQLGLNEKKYFFMDLKGSYTHDNMTFSLVGSLSSVIPAFSNKGFVSYRGNTYIAPISTYGNPQYGTVGDIQSQSSVFAMGRDSFIIPSSSIESVAGQYTINYLFPSKGSDLLNEFSVLPQTIGGITWSSNITYPVGLNPNPGAVQLFLNSDLFDLRYLMTSVCPKITDIFINGCYNCPQKMTFSILASSLCDSGSVKVTIESSKEIRLDTNYLNLGKEIDRYIIYAASDYQTIQGSLCLTYNDQKDCIPFLTVLNDPPKLTQQEMLDQYGNITMGGSGFGSSFADWWNSLTGLSGIIKYIIVACICIGVVSIIIVVSYYAYSYYKKYKGYQMIKKFDNFTDSFYKKEASREPIYEDEF